MNICISVILFFILLICFPFRIKLNLHLKLLPQKIELVSKNNMPNAVTLFAFAFLPVAKLNILKLINNNKLKKEKNITKKTKKKREDNYKEKSSKKKISLIKTIIKALKFKTFSLSLGINTGNYIFNSYLNAAINSIFCMYINVYNKNFNFSNLYYQIYTSCDTLSLDLDTNIYFTLIFVIFNLVKYCLNKASYIFKCKFKFKNSCRPKYISNV